MFLSVSVEFYNKDVAIFGIYSPEEKPGRNWFGANYLALHSNSRDLIFKSMSAFDSRFSKTGWWPARKPLRYHFSESLFDYNSLKNLARELEKYHQGQLCAFHDIANEMIECGKILDKLLEDPGFSSAE